MAEPLPTPVAKEPTDSPEDLQEDLQPSTVTLSAEGGVLLLALDPQASFEALREAVRELFSASPDRFRGKDARLDLDTRPIDLFDLRRLVHVLGDEFGISVTGLFCTEQHLHRYAERELKLKVYPRRAVKIEPELEPEQADVASLEVMAAEVELEEGAPEPAPALAAGEPLPGRRMLTLDRGLRSGQVVSFNGDVTVFGDVNPGAQLVARGNVVVLGALKGMVHAGSEGDESCVVLAFDFQPNQLRIGRHIVTEREHLHSGQPQTKRSRLPFNTGELLRGAPVLPLPSIAWVGGEGGIQIEPYAGRLPR